MQQFDVSFAIRRGAPAPVPSGGCEESQFGVSFVKKRRRCSGEKLRAQMWESRSAAV